MVINNNKSAAVSSSSAEDTQSLDSKNNNKRRGGGGAFGWMRGTPRRNAKIPANNKNAAVTTATTTTTVMDDFGTPKTSNITSSRGTVLLGGLEKSLLDPQEKLAAPSLASNTGSTQTQAQTQSSKTKSSSQQKQAGGILKHGQDRSAAATNTTTVKKPSWFCRTSHFQRMCDAAFDVVDADLSGSVSPNELYSGLLLIHLKLGTYAGPAACRPLSRERCMAVFTNMDHDQSGTLDRTEFRHVMGLLFGNVVARVMVQWSMTLLIVPWVAQFLWHAILQCHARVMDFIENIHLDQQQDSSSSEVVANSFLLEQLTVEDAAAWCLARSPPRLASAAHFVAELVKRVPESVWQAVPLTLLSTVLGIVVVPWCIFQIDDWFQTMADRKAKRRSAAAANNKNQKKRAAAGAESGPWI